MHPDPSTEASRSALVYARIKRDLLAGAFPLSVRLRETRLAEENQVSRTPVREALSRLHAEGLVERHPEGGYAPAVPNLNEIAELYQVRAVLEEAALAAPNHDFAELASLRDDWRAISDEKPEADPGFVLLDEDFHLRLASSAGNGSLVSMLAGVNERIRIVRMHDFLTTARIEATIAQHLSIIDAVIARDGRRALPALTDHLSESMGVVQERAAAAIGRMLTAPRDR